MDVLTHAFLPYGVLTVLRRPRKERWAGAVGGFAPDVDTLWAWSAGLNNDLYALAHRGFSHTFWGTILLATLVLYALSRPGLHRKWPRFSGFALDRTVIPALVAGAWSHLVLDGVTITGTPALWPFDPTRYTLSWFFFSVSYLLLLMLALWIPIWRKRASETYVRNALVAVLAVLAIAGGIRWTSFPSDLEGGEKVTPGAVDWNWIVSKRNDGGVTVYDTNWGREGKRVFFAEHNRTAAAPAIAACEGHDHFISWRWNTWGLDIVNATAREDGGWNVTFRDSARLYAEKEGGFRIFSRLVGSEEERALKCQVFADGGIRISRTGGFWGS